MISMKKEKNYDKMKFFKKVKGFKMDYGNEVEKIGLEVIDNIMIAVTPDSIIAKTDELVNLAFNKDMTGDQKFEWVVDQIKPLLSGLIRFLAERLVQLMYEITVGKVTDFRNAN